MSIYERIKQIRQSKKLKSLDVAQRMNITAAGYSAIETGKTDITWTRMQQIAEALDVPVGELLGLGTGGSGTGKDAERVRELEERLRLSDDRYWNLVKKMEGKQEDLEKRLRFAIDAVYKLKEFYSQLSDGSKDHIDTEFKMYSIQYIKLGPDFDNFIDLLIGILTNELRILGISSEPRTKEGKPIDKEQ